MYLSSKGHLFYFSFIHFNSFKVTVTKCTRERKEINSFKKEGQRRPFPQGEKKLAKRESLPRELCRMADGSPVGTRGKRERRGRRGGCGQGNAVLTPPTGGAAEPSRAPVLSDHAWTWPHLVLSSHSQGCGRWVRVPRKPPLAINSVMKILSYSHEAFLW